tara:strand:+ start:5643 stop:6740 length:1098 start_codon:yes stop_codon:yes gene_type:complete
MVLNIKSLVFILFSAALISIFSMSSSFAVDAESLRSCDGNESTAACNGTCAVNANGAIVIQSNGMPADAGDTSSFRDSCNMIPDRYKVHMFKGGFCTANPAVQAAATQDYITNCDFFYNGGLTGKPLILTSNGDGTASTSTSLLDGNIALGIKKYSHAFVVIESRIGISHTQTFDFSASLDGTTMTGGDADSTNATTGTTCWTIDAYSGFSNTSGTLFGESLRTGDPDTPATLSTECGSSAPAEPVYAYEVYESFGSHNNLSETVIPYFSEVMATDTGASLGGTKSGVLMHDDLVTTSTAMVNSKSMLYVMTFDSPLVINENTSRLDIKFGVSEAVSLDFSNTSGGALTYIKNGADPVDITFEAN